MHALVGKLKNRSPVGFWRPYLCPSKGHKHGVSIQSFIYLGKTVFRISRKWNIAQTSFLAKPFAYLSSFISQILDFLYWMVCNFIPWLLQWKPWIKRTPQSYFLEGISCFYCNFNLPFFFYKKKQNKTHKSENKINVIQSWSSFLITIIPFEHIVLFIAIIGRGSVYAMINYSVWGRCHPPKLDNTLRVYIVREQIIF